MSVTRKRRSVREMLLANGWKEQPNADGWHWIAGPGRRMKAAEVTFSRGRWWVHGGGGGGPLGSRLVYSITVPPGVRFAGSEVKGGA